jgi:hypothetical protein
LTTNDATFLEAQRRAYFWTVNNFAITSADYKIVTAHIASITDAATGFGSSNVSIELNAKLTSESARDKTVLATAVDVVKQFKLVWSKALIIKELNNVGYVVQLQYLANYQTLTSFAPAEYAALE